MPRKHFLTTLLHNGIHATCPDITDTCFFLNDPQDQKHLFYVSLVYTSTLLEILKITFAGKFIRKKIIRSRTACNYRGRRDGDMASPKATINRCYQINDSEQSSMVVLWFVILKYLFTCTDITDLFANNKTLCAMMRYDHNAFGCFILF